VAVCSSVYRLFNKQTLSGLTRSEVLKAVNLDATGIRDIRPNRLADIYRRFGKKLLYPSALKERVERSSEIFGQIFWNGSLSR
jgi:hypothetical protein